MKSSLMSIFLGLAFSLSGCINVLPEDLNLNYEGEWAIERLVQVTATGEETIQENPGTLNLIIDPDKTSSGPSASNPMGFSGDVYRNLYAFQFMAALGVLEGGFTWFTDEQEFRIFLQGIGPLTSYIQVYTIQESKEDIQETGTMTWFLVMDDGRQETVHLRRIE